MFDSEPNYKRYRIRDYEYGKFVIDDIEYTVSYTERPTMQGNVGEFIFTDNLVIDSDHILINYHKTAIGVFVQVVNFVMELILENQPRYWGFKSTNPRKTRFYLKLLNKYDEQLCEQGYQRIDSDDDEIVFMNIQDLDY